MAEVRSPLAARAAGPRVKPPRPSLSVIAAFLIKLAKHMGLIACLMIVGSATGRATVSQLGIFFLIAAAAVVYSTGRSLERRLPEPIRLPLRGP